MSKLLPCPKCENMPDSGELPDGRFRIICMSCGREFRISDMEEAIAAWNRRAGGTCAWTYDPQHCKYDGTCGVEWCFSEGTATETGVNYCPQCGDKVEVAK